MTRRRPGQSAITTTRNEKDRVEISSETEFGVTLGTPTGMRFMNENQRPKDYGNSTMDFYPRPSHADWTYLEKYGVKASSGGGRSSARETIGMLTRAAGLQEVKMLTTTAGRVAAEAIAEKYLRLAHGIEVVAFVSSVGNEFLFPPTPTHPTLATNLEFLKMIEATDRETVGSFAPVRCPNEEASKRMEKLVADSRDRHDSIRGTVTCVIRNCPSGLGEPCFDKLEAMLAHAMLSIPATKAFEIGSGFGGCQIPGSIHNDPFIKVPAVPPTQSGAYISTPRPRLTTKINNFGGI
jgi:chorismate synthase